MAVEDFLKRLDQHYANLCGTTPPMRNPTSPPAYINGPYANLPLALTTGVKYDDDKLRYDLIPPLALDELVKVLTHGAKKYDDDNWRNVENWKKRYFAATQRHQWQWKRGKIMDNEPDTKGNPGSNCHHIACAIASLMFLLEKELEAEKENLSKTLTKANIHVGMTFPYTPIGSQPETRWTVTELGIDTVKATLDSSAEGYCTFSYAEIIKRLNDEAKGNTNDQSRK